MNEKSGQLALQKAASHRCLAQQMNKQEGGGDKRVAVLLSPEHSRKKDFIHWKNSGFK